MNGSILILFFAMAASMPNPSGSAHAMPPFLVVASAPEAEAGSPTESELPATPPGVKSDGAGGFLRYHGDEWTLINTLHAYSWDRAAGEWKLAGPVSENNKKAVRNAVEQFNGIPNLRLKLRYEESDDPSLSIKHYRENRERFVIYWADVAEEDILPRPFIQRPDHGSKGGTAVFIKDRNGKFATLRQISGRNGPFEIAGAAIFAREHIKNDSNRCKTDAPYYAMLHEIGHALGLGHATPEPSVMRGKCAKTYLPNDIANLRLLYGR